MSLPPLLEGSPPKRPLNPLSFGLRVVVWVVTAVVCLAIARDGLTGGDLADGLPVTLIITGIPGVIYLFMIRTWVGTLVGTVIFSGGWIGLFAYISAESEKSSTAGLGLLSFPVLIVIPLLVVYAIERRRSTGADRPDPPR